MDEIRVDRIRIDPRLPGRVEMRRIGELARQIEAEGLREPLLVRPRERGSGYDVIHGRRRWAALQWLGRETAPAVVREDLRGNDPLAARVAAEEIGAGWLELGTVERAWAIARLRELTGATLQELARWSRTSKRTARRYAMLGRVLTPELLTAAGVEVDDAQRMPIKALESIARAGESERATRLRATAEARLRGGNMLEAAGVEGAELPYTLRRNRVGGVRLETRSAAEAWPPQVAAEFVREAGDVALPALRGAWDTAGVEWIEDQAQRHGQETGFSRGKQLGMQVGVKAGRQVAEQHTARRVAELEGRLESALAELEALSRERERLQNDSRTTDVRLVQAVDAEAEKRVSALKLQHALAIAELRQAMEQERQEFADALTEAQRTAVAERRLRVALEQRLQELTGPTAPPETQKGRGLGSFLFRK